MKRKKIKNHIVLHPVMSFIILMLITILLSGILSLFNVSASYTTLDLSTKEYVTSTEAINSLLNLSGIKYIFSNTVSNFAHFTVLSHLIIVLLGIGVMEYSGFLRTAIGILTRKSKKNVITYVIVLICLLSSILDNLPFIAFIPLSALIFKYGKRNPKLGIIASFAALTCGYGVSLFFTSIDSQLASLSTISASIIDGNYSISGYSMLLIMLVTLIILSFVITFITENYIARLLPKYNFEEDDEDVSNLVLTNKELKGLILAAIGSIAYIIVFIYNIIPGLPFSGNFLNYSEAMYIDKLFGTNSFFASGFVFIITILFIIWGLLYGIGAKTIKNNRDFIDSLGYSLNGVGKILLLIFMGATFISIFKQTNIGNVIVAWFTNIITSSNFTGIAIVLLLFILSFVATLFVPSTITKWSIMSTKVVPALLNVGISAEFAQIIFRFGESAALGLTPLFAYFIVYIAYLEKYNNDQNMNLAESIKYQVPYSLSTAGVYLVVIILWYIISLPLGVGGFVSI